jgi:hypothetical protein
MFGAFRIAKAQQACVNALRPMIARPQALSPWPPKFWQDPYVLGFVVGTIALMSRLTTNNKLTTEQKGHVQLGTFKDLGGYTPDLIDRLETFMREQNPDYVQGIKNADKVNAYILGGNFTDPDVERATGLARGSGRGPVDRVAIGGSLMHLLFHEPVARRLWK